MKLAPHEVFLDSTSVGGILNTSTDKFTFTEAHGFKHGEELYTRQMVQQPLELALLREILLTNQVILSSRMMTIPYLLPKPVMRHLQVSRRFQCHPMVVDCISLKQRNLD